MHRCIADIIIVYQILVIGHFTELYDEMNYLTDTPLSGYAVGGWVMRRCWVNFRCWGVLLILIIVGQGPNVLAVGVGGGCLDIFFLSSIISVFFLPLSGRLSDIDFLLRVISH